MESLEALKFDEKQKLAVNIHEIQVDELQEVRKLAVNIHEVLVDEMQEGQKIQRVMAKGDTPEGADVDMEERGVSDPRSSEEPEFAIIFDEPKQAELQESRQVQSETRTLAEPPARWKNEDVLMPGITPPHDERHPSPERNPPTLRPHPNDAAIPVPKMRRLSE